MRETITSGMKRMVMQAMKVKNGRVVLLTPENDTIKIAIPDGISKGLVLPPVDVVLRNVAVQMNKAGDTLYGYYPAKGTHVVRFHSFAAKKDADPTPAHIDPQPPKGKRTWWSPEKYIFTALLTVQAGDFKGATVPWTLDYAFGRDVDGTAKFQGTKGQIEKLRHFLELCGFDTYNDVVPYSENILPALAQILSERSDEAVFQVTMTTSESGSAYVDEAAELPAGYGDLGRVAKPMAEDSEDEYEEDDDEDLVPPKKTKGEAVRELDEDEAIAGLTGNGKSRNRAERAPANDFEDDDEDVPPARPAKKGNTGF